jgi:hypothetical protein
METLKPTADNLARIKRAAGDEFHLIEHDIVTRRAILLESDNCVFVLRPEGSELVIVCAEGRNLLKAAPKITQAARKAGFSTMRFHTERPALARLLNNYGFYEAERIFRARL